MLRKQVCKIISMQFTRAWKLINVICVAKHFIVKGIWQHIWHFIEVQKTSNVLYVIRHLGPKLFYDITWRNIIHEKQSKKCNRRRVLIHQNHSWRNEIYSNWNQKLTGNYYFNGDKKLSTQNISYTVVFFIREWP